MPPWCSVSFPCRPIAQLNDRLAASTAKIEEVQVRLSAALLLARDCFDAYRSAPDAVRKLFNAAFFRRIVVTVRDSEPEVRGKLAEPFASLLEGRNENRPSVASGRSPGKTSDAACSSMELLEGRTGIEPA